MLSSISDDPTILDSIQVGTPKSYGSDDASDAHDQFWTTGFFKTPIEGAAFAGNLSGAASQVSLGAVPNFSDAFAMGTFNRIPEQAQPLEWLKAPSEAAQFEAFRSLPEADKLQLLACVVALTLQPKLAPAEGDGATAYDAALSLTAADVAGYWRPTKDNFLGRINRNQLLAIGREVLGETWSQSRSGEKKTLLVDQLDRAFSNPEKSGRTQGQIEKLKSWLPTGMSFDIAAATKPAKTRKAKMAA